jgi:hypothetical protein
MNRAVFWEMVAALVTGIGQGLIWIEVGYCRNVRQTRGSVPATATIDKLDYTGRYLMGRFFALVSFRDAAGIQHAAGLPLTPYIWNRLREGRTLRILYAPSDPRNVSLAGRGVRAVSGPVFVTIGSFLTVQELWLLVGGLVGWVEVDAFHPHWGWLTPLPAPTPTGR